MNLVSNLRIVAEQFKEGNIEPFVSMLQEANKSNQKITVGEGRALLEPVDASTGVPSIPLNDGDWLCRDQQGVYFVISDNDLQLNFSPAPTDPGPEAISPAPAKPEREEFILPHEVDAATKGFAIARPDINPTHNGHVALVKNQGAHLINIVGNIPHDGNSDTARWKSIAITNIETGLLYAEKAAVAK